MTFDFNTIIGICGTLFGLAGIIASYYFYKKTSKTKKLVSYSESVILISENLNKYDNLKISYNNESITSLTSTTIKIKNIGNDIVEYNDLMTASPIFIKTSQKFLIDDISQYEIISSNDKIITSLIKVDEFTLQLIFDLIKPKDEISVTLLHRGDITVTGDLKTNSFKHYNKKSYDDEVSLPLKSSSDAKKYAETMLPIILILTLVLMILLKMLISFYPSTELTSQINFPDWYILVIAFATFLLYQKRD